ncbi:unnamed protein product [Clavelina lepadiformis]|uniref:P2X purinoreceptor 7 intracellular domain-containing protein n=1 Tax=Clavelina lepadiformis TaxID=159417 RepID=A0ABP0H0K9_CLALP
MNGKRSEDYIIPDDISKTADEGPTQPLLPSYPKTPFGNSKSRARSFCSNWYERFAWLEYSIFFDRAYCFACRHFGRDKNEDDSEEVKIKKKKRIVSLYATVGFDQWAKALERMQKHDFTAIHMEANKSWLDHVQNNIQNPELDQEFSEFLNEEKDEKRWPKRKLSHPIKQPVNTQDDVQDKCPCWCSCKACVITKRAHEHVCCDDIPEVKAKLYMADSTLNCITEHPGFASVCLNPWVLQVAYYHHKQESNEAIVMEVHEKYRYIAYCQFVRWCWGYLQKDLHIPLPSCVVSRIKTAFHVASKNSYPSLDDLPCSPLWQNNG